MGCFEAEPFKEPTGGERRGEGEAPTCRLRSSVIRWIWIFFLPIFSGNPHRARDDFASGEGENQPRFKTLSLKSVGGGLAFFFFGEDEKQTKKKPK